MEGVRDMGIVDLRPVLGDRVDAAYYAKEMTVITKKGKRRAAIVPYEWAEKMAQEHGVQIADVPD
jgi:hypothetical protein